MVENLRNFVERLDRVGELRRINGAKLDLEVGCMSEISFQNNGPALLFGGFEGYPKDFRVLSNMCSTQRRSVLAMGLDPDMTEKEVMDHFKARWDSYKAVAPVEVDRAAFTENTLVGEDVDLTRIPVPLWHELDGGPYIGTGVAIILKDPDSGFVNVGCYRLQVHDRYTTGIFSEPHNDGTKIMEKYWQQGKPCPVAVSVGPEPQVFLAAAGSNGCPRAVPEYEYVGFLTGEPVDVVRGNLTGLPISAGSEIVFEGEIPPPEEESRPEGPFGEWTGYYMSTANPEPVIRVKALYFRNNPIHLGASPLKPHKQTYSLSLPMRLMTELWTRLNAAGLPVTRVSEMVQMGAVVISVNQKSASDTAKIIELLNKAVLPYRLFVLVDEDIDPNDPFELFWAIGTRISLPEGAITSTVQSAWRLDPMRTAEERSMRTPIPYKRLIINACRPFDRLNDFAPVNRFTESMRKATWEKWQMRDWLRGNW